MPVLLRVILFSMILTMVVGARPAGAAAVLVPPLAEPVELATSPTIRLIAHGPQSEALYRVTIEVANSGATPLEIAPPLAALRLYRQPDGTFRINSTPTDEGDVWLHWDGDRERRHPVRRLKRAYAIAAGSEALDLQITPNFERTVVIPAGQLVAVDLDFDLPAELPTEFTLHFDGTALGSGVRIEKVVPLSVQAREALSYLRQLAEAKARALRGGTE